MLDMNVSRKGIRGFTLMELMVVMIIIGVLFGIIFTGASYLFSAQEEKKAKAEIETISLALKQFESEYGDFPTATIQDSEEIRGRILFMSLSGNLDVEGEEIDPEEKRNSLLPLDSFTLGQKKDDNVDPYSLNGDQLLGNVSAGEDIFIIDPWENAYVYEYPRSDGHDGYLLFSKGPDGSASSFTSELTSTPEKKDIDNDNIPADEPGKW